MAYIKTTWADRQIQYPGRFTRTSDGTYDTLTPAPGTITQSGTPITSAALNNLETQYDQAVIYADGKFAPMLQALWTAVTFQNAWIDYGNNYDTTAYMKDTLGFVNIKGMIYNGIMPGAAFVLPAGYRPSKLIRFPVQAHNGTAVVVAGVEISPNGNVTVAYGGNTWVVLTGIRFKAEA
jgi:hypothetical protein